MPRRSSDDDRPVELLTSREFEVAQRLSAGQSNGEIATALAISIKTVDTHRGHALTRLGLVNNAELALFWAAVPLPPLETTSIPRPYRRATAYAALLAAAISPPAAEDEA